VALLQQLHNIEFLQIQMKTAGLYLREIFNVIYNAHQHVIAILNRENKIITHPLTHLFGRHFQQHQRAV
jgi:hypothetical protein